MADEEDKTSDNEEMADMEMKGVDLGNARQQGRQCWYKWRRLRWAWMWRGVRMAIKVEGSSQANS